MRAGILRYCLLALITASMMLAPLAVIAQEAPPKPPAQKKKPSNPKQKEKDSADDRDSDDDRKAPRREPGSSGAGRFFQRLARMRPANVNERNHSSVKSAFRSVVEGGRRSTVNVFADGRAAALGAVVTDDGFVLTKASELKGKLECQVADGRRLTAELVGLVREHDLAMIKVEAEDLVPVSWSSDEPPAVGSWLATPSTSRDPAAIGVVSVLPRKIRAARAVLGVTLEPGKVDGAKVTKVLDGSGAQDAGVKEDDIITHVNGQQVKAVPELIDVIRKYRPGDRVLLSLRRGKKPMSLTATLREEGTVTGRDKRERFQNSLGGPELSHRKSGFPAALQHDTVLHPYQCGGPLLNLRGETIGINIAHAGRVNSFALTTAVIRPLLDDLKSGKLRPGPSPAELRLQLATKLVQLRDQVDSWKLKLAQLNESLKESIDAEVKADAEAKKPDAPKTARVLLEKTRKAKQDLERATSDAKTSLDKLIEELKKTESEQVSLDGSK